MDTTSKKPLSIIETVSIHLKGVNTLKEKERKIYLFACADCCSQINVAE